MKILINNEEIYCSNKITIQEQMLSTSSTILNNCYPIEWEETKDYVSNYYYPKDYSKCLIKEEDYNIYQNFSIYGETYQATPATFNYEQPIINKTGIINEIIEGKTYQINLGTIELTENDEISPIDGKWYILRSMKKIRLTSDMAWTLSATRTNTVQFRLYHEIDDMYQSTPMRTVFCNYCTNFLTSTAQDTEGMYFSYTRASHRSNIYFSVNKNTLSSLEEWEQWLDTHELILYYGLQVTEETELTDEDLLNQLNSIGEEIIFCGVVKRTGNISLNPRHFHGCDLQILDFKDFLSTGETLDFVISNRTILEAIQMVVSTVSEYGVVLGNVNILNADEIIGAYSTLDKTAYDVFQYLADISGSRWNTRLVNENTIAVDFYDPSLMPEGANLDYTQEWFEENNLVDMSYTYSTTDYRNKQTIKSKEIYADINYTQSVFADGYNTTFPLESNIAQMVSITLNGVELTFATSTEKEFGTVADVYYTVGQNTITTDTTYIAGSELIVTYTPIIRGRQTLYNDDEIDRIQSQINRKGVISRYEDRNDVVSSNELIAIAETYLTYKGKAEIELTIELENNNLWNVGEVVEVSNVPIDDLNTKYMVKTKTTEMNIATNNIFYKYVLTSSYNSENAINYFDNQRAKAEGNLEVGDFIDRDIDIINSAMILFTDVTAEVVGVIGDNVLDSVLDSPFNN